MLKDLLAKLGINFEKLIVKRKINNIILYSIILRNFSRLKILIRCRYFIIIDAAYNTNNLH